MPGVTSTVEFVPFAPGKLTLRRAVGVNEARTSGTTLASVNDCSTLAIVTLLCVVWGATNPATEKATNKAEIIMKIDV